MQYICSNTGMRACSNNNMSNPIRCKDGLYMLLLYALNPCLATGLVSPIIGTLTPTSFNIIIYLLSF